MRETSVAAYNDLVASGLLGEMQLEVVRALCAQSRTGSEIDRDLNTPSAHKRLSELEKMGVIASMGERVCTVTGRTVLYWALTGNMPVALQQAKPAGRKTVKISKETIEDAVRCIRREMCSDGDGGEPPPDSVVMLLQWLDPNNEAW